MKKKLLMGLLIGLLSTNVFAYKNGSCVANEYTGRYVAPSCHLMPDADRCENIGCEWLEKKYRCRAGEYTGKYVALSCHLMRDEGRCENIGCEWVSYYSH